MEISITPIRLLILLAVITFIVVWMQSKSTLTSAAKIKRKDRGAVNNTDVIGDKKIDSSPLDKYVSTFMQKQQDVMRRLYSTV